MTQLKYLPPKHYFEGTAAERTTNFPSVTTANNGLVWFETDTNIKYQVREGTWLGYIDTIILDATYLRLDATNDPMTGDLDMGDNALENVSLIDFDLVNGIVTQEGRMSWNDDDGTLNLGLKGGVVNLQIGQEEVIRGKNTSGSAISDGAPVRISGATDSSPEFGLAEADVPATAGSIGLATEGIPNNQFGYVTTMGLVRGVDTSGTPVGEVWSAADRLFVSNTAGELTNVAPTSTERIIFIGLVIRAHATEGVIWVSSINVSYLSELSGVTITAVTDNEFLAYDSASGLWINQTPTEAGLDAIYLKLDATNDPVTGDLLIKPAADSAQVLQVQQNDTTPVLTVNTLVPYVEMHKFVYTPSSVTNITAAGGITPTHSYMLIQGDGAPIDITANPQIVAGDKDGQVLLIQGQDDTDTVQLDNGDGLHLHGGKAILGNHDYILFNWDDTASQWEEITRDMIESEKSWGFFSPTGASGTFYRGGFYIFGSTDNDFNPSITFGTANSSYAAHFWLVQAAGAAAGTDTVIRITGTSIDDDGVRTGGDTQDLTVDDAGAAGTYYETSKKWLGQLTIAKISGPDLLCNYGFAKYWDNNNSAYRIRGIETTFQGGANDGSADIKLLHHRAAGWIYNAGSSADNPTELASMATDHAPERNIVNGEPGAWKRVDLNTIVQGDGSEGTIFEIVTSANKTFEDGDILLRIRPD